MNEDELNAVRDLAYTSEQLIRLHAYLGEVKACHPRLLGDMLQRAETNPFLDTSEFERVREVLVRSIEDAIARVKEYVQKESSKAAGALFEASVSPAPPVDPIRAACESAYVSLKTLPGQMSEETLGAVNRIAFDLAKAVTAVEEGK